MLARNPALTWRDVQHILVRSSRRVDSGRSELDTDTFPHSEKYGFGIVDALSAGPLRRDLETSRGSAPCAR